MVERQKGSVSKEVTAVLLAAGEGTRLGVGKNKVYLPLAGKPVLSYSLRAFDRSLLVDQIVLVVASGEEARAGELLGDLAKDNRLVRGGARRRDSALAGVEAADGKIVLIHDAARPFPSPTLIERVIEGTRTHGACVPVIPVLDTVRYGNRNGFLLSQPIAREGLLRMQTPQGFERALIVRCLKAGEGAFTDDAGAVLASGASVWSVPGEAINLKVTTKADLALAEAIAAFIVHTGD